LASLGRKERKGKRRGAAESAAAAAAGGAGEKKGRGERERLTSGARLSVRAGKRKEREREGGPARGEGWWAAGPPGPKGWPVLALFFSFSFLFFQTSFSNPFFNSNSNQTFANFSQEFDRRFRNHTSNQNHASQLMMHIHLLSLSLLNCL
jgi:hypothetical protein